MSWPCWNVKLLFRTSHSFIELEDLHSRIFLINLSQNLFNWVILRVLSWHKICQLSVHPPVQLNQVRQEGSSSLEARIFQGKLGENVPWTPLVTNALCGHQALWKLFHTWEEWVVLGKLPRREAVQTASFYSTRQSKNSYQIWNLLQRFELVLCKLWTCREG